MPIRYSALYRAARVAARSRAEELPTVLVARGTTVYRNVPMSLGEGLVGEALARTIYRSEENAWNRWTGRTSAADPSDRAGVGGLYVTLDLDALIAEMWHYTFKRTVEADMREQEKPRDERAFTPLTPKALRDGLPGQKGKGLPSRRIFCYEVARETAVGDVALGSPNGARFLEDVWEADVVQDAAKGTPYRAMRAAHNASSDHSFARGVCQGLYDALPRLAGIQVTSVRTDAATTLGASGYNLVFLGEDGARIELLRPVREISFVPRPAGGVDQVDHWFARA